MAAIVNGRDAVAHSERGPPPCTRKRALGTRKRVCVCVCVYSAVRRVEGGGGGWRETPRDHSHAAHEPTHVLARIPCSASFTPSVEFPVKKKKHFRRARTLKSEHYENAASHKPSAPPSRRLHDADDGLDGLDGPDGRSSHRRARRRARSYAAAVSQGPTSGNDARRDVLGSYGPRTPHAGRDAAPARMDLPSTERSQGHIAVRRLGGQPRTFLQHVLSSRRRARPSLLHGRHKRGDGHCSGSDLCPGHLERLR